MGNYFDKHVRQQEISQINNIKRYWFLTNQKNANKDHIGTHFLHTGTKIK